MTEMGPSLPFFNDWFWPRPCKNVTRISGKGTFLKGQSRFQLDEPLVEVRAADHGRSAAVTTNHGAQHSIIAKAIFKAVDLVTQRLGDVVLIGSSHCAGTLRVKEFLSRNGHPYQYIDLDREAEAQNLRDRFDVSVADVPVLICRGDGVLRNPSNPQIIECLGFNLGEDDD